MEEKLTLEKIAVVAGPDVMDLAYEVFSDSEKAADHIDQYLEKYFTSPKVVFNQKSIYEMCESGDEGKNAVLNFLGHLRGK